MTRRNILIASLLLLVGCQTSRALAAFSIFSSDVVATVEDGSGGSDEDSGTSSASASFGVYASETTGNWSISGDTANLVVTLSHERGGDSGGLASSTFDVRFTPAVLSSFTASGFYNNQNGLTLFSSDLFDGNTNDSVFASSQTSLDGATSFVLGGADGNISNSFTGSLTGYLQPGHLYEWKGTASTLAILPGSSSIADGSFALSIVPVPEASAFVLWAISLLTIGAASTWYRSKPTAS